MLARCRSACSRSCGFAGCPSGPMRRFLLSAGETTAGTTLPSVSVPPIVGSKAREQRVSDVTAKVDAGRMQKPRSKQVSWSRTAPASLPGLCQQ